MYRTIANIINTNFYNPDGTAKCLTKNTIITEDNNSNNEYSLTLSLLSTSDNKLSASNKLSVDNNTSSTDNSKEETDRLLNTNGINFNIGGSLSVSGTQEQHIHQETHNTWGGDIGRAALGGAITGIMTSIGIKGGEYLGNLAGNAFSDLASSSLSKSITQVLTASVNASVNAATMSTMNTIGNSMSNTAMYGGNFKDVLKSGRDSMRDKDNLKSIAVSTLGAGITAGITTKLNIVKPTTFTDKLTKNAIDGATNTALQSTINGDSFKDTLKHQVVNSLVMTGAEYWANAIGDAYKNNNINKFTQLSLHAGLGAVSSKLTGGDFASGAVAGVVGEIAGGYLKNNTGLDNESVVKYSGLISGLSAIVVSKANNGDIKDITNSAFAGQRVGENAVRNNLLYDQLLGDSKVTSEFKKDRKHPIDGVVKNHNGVDTIPLTDNTTVHAAADGTVIYTEPQVDKTTGELKG